MTRSKEDIRRRIEQLEDQLEIIEYSNARNKNADRPRGILTEADRKYLLGESDLESCSHGERRARERIRNRSVEGILDMVLLSGMAEQRDVKQISSKLSDETIVRAMDFLEHLREDVDR